MTEPIEPGATVRTDESAPRSRTGLRIGALVVITIALLAIGHATGATEHLTQDRIQALMSELGALGLVAFVVLFTIGELVHVPGMVFVVAAILAYGPWLGFGAGLGGAIVSLSASFWIVRLVGGQPLGQIQRPFVRRMLARLETQPILTIAILRVLFQMLPALNYGLAMSKVRFRDYLVGSVLGLVPVIAFVAAAFDWVVATFFA
jgi:uncharacterized membrane protein YdjX (TVP38/TMEM64 family)